MALRLGLARGLLNIKSSPLRSSFSLNACVRKEDFEIDEILKRKGDIEGALEPLEQPVKYPHVEKRKLEEDLVSFEPFLVNEISGVPKEHVKDRLVRIAKATKNAMQSGTDNIDCWVLSFDNRQRWENGLIGWVSSGDPLSNLQLRFPSKEQAVDYCEKYTYPYYVVEEKPVAPRKKSYAANFSWNKRSRVSTK